MPETAFIIASWVIFAVVLVPLLVIAEQRRKSLHNLGNDFRTEQFRLERAKENHEAEVKKLKAQIKDLKAEVADLRKGE